MKQFLKEVVKHLIIMTFVCLIAVIFMYVMGNFVELHPDAYVDIVFSIVFVYVICFIVTMIYKFLIKRFTSKLKINFGVNDVPPFEIISKIFLVLTFVNSLMMLTGYDVAKEGVFAYAHMMIRLLIITTIISLVMRKEIINNIKIFKLKSDLYHFYKNMHSKLFASTAIIFTVTTVIYSVFMIAFRKVIDNLGGSFYYFSLIFLSLSILLFLIILRFLRNKKRG